MMGYVDKEKFVIHFIISFSTQSYWINLIFSHSLLRETRLSHADLCFTQHQALRGDQTEAI
jgi:hypothetical protein